VNEAEIATIMEYALPFKARAHFVMIGNSLHQPNYDAILFMKKEIWPQIRNNDPNVELHIYGAYQTQKILQLNDKKSGFLIKGHASDAIETIRKYRLLLAPIRYGAGLKGKIFDAMKAATPVAMTTIAAEGMFENTATYGFVDDDPVNYAQKCLQLYNSESEWQSVSLENSHILKSNYLGSAFAKALLTKTSQLISYKSPEINRNNFSSKMLNYHSNKATKFMSKWIEERNASQR
jgi:glycosyltransferase involved in cell wall biosynthesis